jgi:hypothetical protein
MDIDSSPLSLSCSNEPLYYCTFTTVCSSLAASDFFEPGFERIQLIGGHRARMTRSKPRVSELTVVKVQYFSWILDEHFCVTYGVE